MMVVIGGGWHDGKDWLVVQNFWEDWQFFAVSVDYLKSMGALLFEISSRDSRRASSVRLGRGIIRWETAFETLGSSQTAPTLWFD
jgi:hypothetical protein